MRFLDLFAGIGGFSLGLERAGMTCVGHVEIDPFCWKVLRKHWPKVPLIADVKEVQGDEFGAVELICGGPPCQPVSIAGKRQGQSDDRWLWGEALRLVEVLRPPWPTPLESTGGPEPEGKTGRKLVTVAMVGHSMNGSNAPMEKLGALNPAFVCWLMGFPDGWLD